MTNSISLKDLTIKCQEITKNKIKIKKIIKTSIFDIPYFVTDNNKIKKFYKWKPSRNINQLIRDIHFWLKTQNNLKNFFK